MCTTTSAASAASNAAYASGSGSPVSATNSSVSKLIPMTATRWSASRVLTASRLEPEGAERPAPSPWPVARAISTTANGRPPDTSQMWSSVVGRDVGRLCIRTRSSVPCRSSGRSGTWMARFRRSRLALICSTRRPPVAVADDDEGAFPADAPGEVVQQAEAGLVRLVHVVDGEQQTGARRREPQQLGRGNEQPLVGALAAPRQLGARPDAVRSPARYVSASPSSSVGCRRHRSASASSTGAYGQAPSTAAATP